jgi:hypothetical protein
LISRPMTQFLLDCCSCLAAPHRREDKEPFDRLLGVVPLVGLPPPPRPIARHHRLSDRVIILVNAVAKSDGDPAYSFGPFRQSLDQRANCTIRPCLRLGGAKRGLPGHQEAVCPHPPTTFREGREQTAPVPSWFQIRFRFQRTTSRRTLRF